MRRRDFLNASLATVPLAGLAAAPAADADGVRQPKPPAGAAGDAPESAVRVKAGEDRFREPYRLNLGHMECKVSAKDTAGALSVFEALTHKPDRPVKHLHHEQDEWFHVLEGEYVMHVGDETFRLGPGDSVLAPRKVPHVWGCVSEKPGRLLVVFQPAGTMEAFFRELPRYVARNAPPEEFQKLNRSHGMEVVGPRLPVE
jgi:mannose-6-phosphate isomerase-like protein (cupin superfamily)